MCAAISAINQHQKHQDSTRSSLVIKVFALLTKFPKSQKYPNVRKIVYLIRGTCYNKNENIIGFVLYCSIIRHKTHVHMCYRSEVTLTNFANLRKTVSKNVENSLVHVS